MVKAQTLKGFRDFLPSEIRKRQFVLDTLKKVFELYGFEPLETPSLEYEEILTGKYGDEGEKLMYRFEDLGKRKVAMRYDQTVPLARVVAQYQNELPLPFKRYQIQNVWRAENTQKGRYREFLQVDADIVGVYSPLADVEILELVYESFKRLGLDILIRINDKNLVNGINPKFLSIIDKMNKIGKESVIKELKELNAEDIFKKVTRMEPTSLIANVMTEFQKRGFPLSSLIFDNTLVRGLDYYTGIIIEVVLSSTPKSPALGGGGRFDNLIGIFSGRDIPAVGFSFGFDRLVEAMDEGNLFPKDLNGKSVFVAFSNSDLQEKSLEITTKLRKENIDAQYYLEDADLEKQLKYADKLQIPYSIIVEEGSLILKDMEKRTQETLPLTKIIESLK